MNSANIYVLKKKFVFTSANPHKYPGAWKKIHVFEGGWMVVDIFFYNINRAQFNVVEKKSIYKTKIFGTFFTK